PDLVWTSTARRAMATCHFFAQTMGWPSSVLTARDDLYLAEPFDLLRWVRGCHDDVQHLAVVGHNPGLEALWAWLCRSEAQGLPPCGVVLIRLKVKTWLEVDEGTGDLLDFILPQSLAERRS
ncbi:MAG: hypothetical protein VX252_04630, partial [Myxococcota bacterium]|nr:hypothetical protein [Myxococcota bacterium]